MTPPSAGIPRPYPCDLRIRLDPSLARVVPDCAILGSEGVKRRRRAGRGLWLRHKRHRPPEGLRLRFGVLAIDLNPNPHHLLGLFAKESLVVLAHVPRLGYPRPFVRLSGSDHHRFQASKRRGGGVGHGPRRGGAVPDIGNEPSPGEGKDELGSLVVGGTRKEIPPLLQLSNLPLPRENGGRS